MKYKLIIVVVLVLASIAAAQEYKVKFEPLSQAEQTQIAATRDARVKAQAALDKATADEHAATLSILKAHGYDESYLGQRPTSTKYVTLSDKNLVLHEVCSECQ